MDDFVSEEVSYKWKTATSKDLLKNWSFPSKNLAGLELINIESFLEEEVINKDNVTSHNSILSQFLQLSRVFINQTLGDSYSLIKKSNQFFNLLIKKINFEPEQIDNEKWS